MSRYLVVWMHEVEATTPEEAADLARQEQLNPEATDTTFHIADIGAERVHRASERVRNVIEELPWVDTRHDAS